MIEELFSQKSYKVILLLIGFLFLLSGIFKIDDISKFAITPYLSILLLPTLLGLLFISLSILIHLEIGMDIFNSTGIKVEKTKKGGFITKIDETNLMIHFSKIDDIEKDENHSAVILPANEFFDDECILDERSSLGAYMQKHFKNQNQEIQKLVSQQLDQIDQCNILEVEKEIGKRKMSYGIGTGIFLDKPLNTNERIIFISVTEQRAGHGLYSNISFIFKAVTEIYKIICDKRIDNIYLPLLGSGHGGLKPTVALFSLILAFSEIVRKSSSHKLQNINIVIYQKSQDTKPLISKGLVKKILKFAVGITISGTK
jgi:hypothetical protein